MIGRWTTAATLLALAGCQASPASPQPGVVQDMEFLRGCWVSKAGPNGPVTGFLRLLPVEPDSAAYSGASQTVQGNLVRDRFRFSFARDGSSLSIVYPNGATEVFSARPPAQGGGRGSRRAVYALGPQAAASASLVVEGDGDALAIFPLNPDGGRGDDFFKGERDGCD